MMEKTENINDQVKRPMNAFMLWSKQKRREISKQDPTLHNAQISKLLGEKWKIMPLEKKMPFVEESQKLMIKHKKEHPNYRYKPRQNKLIKNTFSPSYSTKIAIDPQPEYKRYNPIYRSYSYHSEIAANDEYYQKNTYRHHPYYQQRYRVCNIPGCYECRYNDPYYFSQAPYHTMRVRYRSESPQSSSCSCCSLPITHPNKNTDSTSCKQSRKSSRSSFSVESLIANDKDRSARKSDERSYGHTDCSLNDSE